MLIAEVNIKKAKRFLFIVFTFSFLLNCQSAGF
jgi:hypothetical protein